MNYSICDLTIAISDPPCVLLRNYNPFRSSGVCDPDIRYTCIRESVIALPDSTPVFECLPGTKVYREADGSFSHYYVIPDGRLTCKMISQAEERKLYYFMGTESIFTELDLINSMYLDGALAEKGRFILHSSFISTPQGAILFTAPSGTGKSTQADLWEKYRGAEVINGDRSGLWREGDTFMAGGVPWCGTSGIMKNRQFPLKASVVLRQGPVNQVSSLRMIAKIGRMMEQTTINDWNKQMFQDAQEFWIDLCSRIPVVELTCTPDERAVKALEEALGM